MHFIALFDFKAAADFVKLSRWLLEGWSFHIAIFASDWELVTRTRFKMGRGRPRKKVDANMVRQMAMIGATIKMIAEHCGVCHDVIERRFKAELTEGRSDGQLRILGRIYQAALAGQPRAMELAAVNLCGWKLRPEVNINVLQTGGLSPAEVRTNLAELREAVRAEGLREAVTPIEVEVVRNRPSDGKTNGEVYLSGQLPAPGSG